MNESIILRDKARFTVITENLIRLEYAENRVFCDDETLFRRKSSRRDFRRKMAFRQTKQAKSRRNTFNGKNIITLPKCDIQTALKIKLT
ncbi:MAG: hypothetical protein J6K63_05580 [Clostridia bacterium]|nr:hypothetical protein [Clostridia bacterium]